MSEFKCTRCTNTYYNYESLRRHSVIVHKVKSETFYIEYYLNNIRPTCKCGCNETTRFRGGTLGFADYKQGHISRIVNNWGHNQIAINKSSETRRQQYKDGDRKVWNDGLTKNDDIRVAEYGLKSTKENNPKRAKRISKSLKIRYDNGTLSNIGRGLGLHRSQEFKDKMRILVLKRMHYRCRNAVSKLELEFMNILNSLNIKYTFQFPAYDINSFYDFIINDTRILIEVDGDYWHCNPNTKYKIPKYVVQFANLKGDKIKNEWAIVNGYKLLRFWENDIKNNRLEVVSKIINELKK